MNTKKLTEEEMAPLRIAALPTRPTAPTAFGGKGYTATEMKAAFDKLPNLIAERLNGLITDIESGEIMKIMKTPTEEAETLDAFFAALNDGTLPGLIKIFGTTLSAYLIKLRDDVDLLISERGE